MMYDCIIVGAGIAGATAARRLAEEKNKKVLVMLVRVLAREHNSARAVSVYQVVRFWS